MIVDWYTNITLSVEVCDEPNQLVEGILKSIVFVASKKHSSYTLTVKIPTDTDVKEVEIKSKDLQDVFVIANGEKVLLRETEFFKYLGIRENLIHTCDIFLNDGDRISLKYLEIFRSAHYNDTEFYGTECRFGTDKKINLRKVAIGSNKPRKSIQIDISSTSYTIDRLVNSVLPKVGSSGFFYCEINGNPTVLEGILVKVDLNESSKTLVVMVYNEYELGCNFPEFVYCKTYAELSELRRTVNTDNYQEALDTIESNIEENVLLNNKLTNLSYFVSNTSGYIACSDGDLVNVKDDSPYILFTGGAL